MYTVRALVEVGGSPKEHIEKVLIKVDTQLRKEQNIDIVNTEIGEVEKKDENIFSGFVEIEFKVKDFIKLNQFCLDYMPATIEVLDTNKIEFKLSEFNGLINDFLSKLHNYNMALYASVQKTKKLELMLKKKSLSSKVA